MNVIEEFRLEKLSEIRNNARINFSDPTYEFLKFYTDTLIESEEILEFNEYDIELTAKNNRKAKIDGYYYDSLDRSISLFIADFSNDNDIHNLINDDINRLQRRVYTYLDCIYSGYIKNNCEESSQSAQLAYEIIQKDKYFNKIYIYILSDSRLSYAVKDLSANDFMKKKVEIKVWDINRIYNLIKSSYKREDLSIVFDEKEFSSNDIKCIKVLSEEKFDSYLGVIEGSLLANLYIKYGSKLLEGNVRSFLSVRGKINKGIRSTIISNNPENFFIYNNGIACTASDIEYTYYQGTICIKKLVNFQIINGGQTTASIANVVLQDKKRIKNLEEKIEKIKVPFKLTVVKTNANIDDEIEYNEEYNNLNDNEKKDRYFTNMISNIARYANSQNKVDEADFFSNHPYHVRFEELSRKVLAPPKDSSPYDTYWFYERAKGQYTQSQMKLTASEKKKFKIKYPKNQMIKKTDLAKYWMTYYQYPNIVSKGNQYNMRVFASKISKEWNNDKEATSFNVYYYKKSIALAIMFKETEKLVSRQEWYRAIKAYRANIVTYSLSLLFYMIEFNYSKYEINFLRIWNKQELYEELYEQLIIFTYQVYEYITREDKNMQTKNVTEWCKKEACWTNLIEEVKKGLWKFENAFVNSLISKNDNLDIKIKEKKEQKENDAISAQTKVINLGDAYWNKCLSWGLKMGILDEIETSFLKYACDFSKKIPSDKQCKRILLIHEKLKLEGFC